MKYTIPNVSNVREYKTTLKDFKGVDYSKAKTNVSLNHSTDMRNLLFKNGNLHKRNGFEEMIKLPGKINGYWEFTDSYGNNHKIIHSGTKIFKIIVGDSILNSTYTELSLTYTPSIYSSNASWTTYLTNAIKNQKSYGVVRGNRLYILCGTFLVYGTWNNGTTWELRPVRDNSDTYIPITSTNVRSDGTSALLDEINIMSCRRKNRLIGENTIYAIFNNDPVRIDDISNNDSTSYEGGALVSNLAHYKAYKYATRDFGKIKISIYLDEGYTANYAELVHTIPLAFEGTKTFNTLTSFSDVGLDDEKLIQRNIFTESRLQEHMKINLFSLSYSLSSDGTLTLSVITGTNYVNEDIVVYPIIEIYKTREKVATYQLDAPSISSSNEVTVKNIETNTSINSENYEIDYSKGIISFSGIDLRPSINEMPNIEVEFTSNQYLIDRKYEVIDKCTFGTIFSLNDLDTLFVSGNSEMPNYDFHTSIAFSETNSTISNYENFTYFSDLGYAMVGLKQNAISGYTLLDDGLLGIHKKYSNNEANFFIRKAQMTDALDVSGANVYLQDGTTKAQTISFPQYSTAIGEGCINYNTCKTLVNDKLFLSQNGIFGLELNESIKTNERYAKQRSIMINDVLKKEDLSNANAIVYDGMYLLYVGGTENKVYVADSRFKVYSDDDLRDTFSYEWFVLNNIDAQIWYIDNNNKLWFGDNNGRLCMFKDNIFKDTIYKRLACTLDEHNSNCLVLEENEYVEDDEIVFAPYTNLYEVLLTEEDIVSKDGNYIKMSEQCFENRIKYCLNDELKILVSNNTEINGTITIEETDEDNTIVISGFIAPLETLNIVILKKIKSANITIREDKVFIKDYATNEDGEYYTKIISHYSGFTPTFVSNFPYIRTESGVNSYLFTPVLSLGTNEYCKTINSITTTFEPIANSKINLGYVTRVVDNNLIYSNFVTQGNNVFNYFNDFSLENVSFEDSTLTKSYTKKMKIKNFNVIQLFFNSSNEYDCVLSSIMLSYTIGKKNRGVN